MKTPKFWKNKNSIISVLLIPLSLLWLLATFIKRKQLQKLDIPVIKIGNVVAGGAGKTPTVITLAKKLKNSGNNVHIISKGYKSSAQKSIQVNIKQHTFKQVGDEALLCAKIVPTWVGKSRLQSIKCAIKAGASLVILDDGIQDNSIQSNLNILIFNGSQGIGNGRIIPAGPLRENLQTALRKSQLAIMIEEDKSNVSKLIKNNIPLLNANIKIENKHINNFKNKKVIAFCGIGFPEKFYKTLEKIGCNITYKKSFADHYIYTNKDIKNLFIKAHNLDSLLITTEKDHVKIMKEYKNKIFFLPISIEFSNYDLLDSMLVSAINT